MHFAFTKDYLSEQILTLQINVSFWFLNEICIYQLADYSYIKQKRLKNSDGQ